MSILTVYSEKFSFYISWNEITPKLSKNKKVKNTYRISKFENQFKNIFNTHLKLSYDFYS